MRSNAPVREKLAPLFAIKAVLVFYVGVAALVFMVMQGCSTDAQFDVEKVDVNDPDVCVDTANCDQDDDGDTDNGGDTGNGNGGNGDDDDDDDNPGQNDDCTTVELGDYVSKNIRLGTLKKKTCPLSIKLFVTKFNGDNQTIEYTKFQEVTIGQAEITCPKLIKRYDIDGLLLEKQEFDGQCNLI